MRVPLSWLRDFVPVELDANELSDVFNSLGLIVEGVEHIGGGLEGVVVGRAVDVRTHPNADLVRLADVDLGTGETVQIACGAVNLEAGQLVPVATIGTTLPNGMTIEKRKLRGEWSNGMICSAEELGLPKGVERGILVLPDDLTVGADFAASMKIERDTVFDLEIETNRPDAMCITGVARDIAGKLDLPFNVPEPQVVESGPAVETLVTVNVEDSELCPRFTARAISNVQVRPSNDLVARRLTLAGMRPINNIVDASNYVMLELGQPSHPYDAEKLTNNKLTVRLSRSGEAIETLDGNRRPLPKGAPAIADGDDSVIGVAGIMGGASSEISDATSIVVNEAAVWEPYAINRASRQLALRTDASARFERRVDRAAVLRAQDRFCEILLQTSPDAVVATGVIDVDTTESWPSPAEQLNVRIKRVNSILGTELDSEQISGYLNRIGFATTAVDDDGATTVTVPAFRPDVEREIDVIEEVARIHGYDNIGRRVPTSPTAARLTPYQLQRRRIRTQLVGRGLTEAWTASMLGEEDFAKSGITESPIAVTNPMTQEDSRMRTSLLPGMLRAIAYNTARRNNVLRLFEIGHVFHAPVDGDLLPDEREMLAIAVLDESSDAKTASYLARDIALSLGAGGIRVEPGESDGLHPTRTARLTSDGASIGVLGEVDPEVLGRYGIDGRVAWIEIDLAELVDTVETTPKMRAVSKFPSAEFDLAVVVSDDVTAEQVIRTLYGALEELGEEVSLFDVYRGAQVAEGARSLAFRVRISNLERTLGDKEIAEARAKAIKTVEAVHGATLRA